MASKKKVLTMPTGKHKMTQVEMASKGGKARAAKLTAQQRSDAARKAARKRWAKKKHRKV